MPQPAYPTAADVTVALQDQGLPIPSTLETLVAAVVSDFEDRTAYRPFLASDTATDRTFDPPYRVGGYILDLEGGFVTVDSIKINDQTLSATYYDLLPLNSEDGRGWDQVRFKCHPGFCPASIVVTGKRGLFVEVPDDAYMAILEEAMARAIPAAQQGTGVQKRVKQGGFEVEYDESSHLTKIDLFHGNFEATVASYRRI